MKFSSSSFKRQNGCATQPGRICLYPKTLPSLATKSQIQSEYGQLQEMVPTLAKQYHVTKVSKAIGYLEVVKFGLFYHLSVKMEISLTYKR